MRRFWISLWERLTGKRRVRRATKVESTFISHEGDMQEKYRINWIPSPSSFVDYVTVHWQVDDGAISVSPQLLPNITAYELILPTGGVCEVWVKTVGDNGTEADSAHLTFDVLNLEAVEAATNVTATWLAHIV